MKKSKIRYLTISDIHFGNKRNTTQEIKTNLVTFFRKNMAKLRNLDIIFIDGDTFDKLLTPYSDDFRIAASWINELATFCFTHSIMLRWLEGTPSHDWRQMTVIHDTIMSHKHNLDFKYMTTLTIEKIDSLGISVLYVPDEYRPTAKETELEVTELLKQSGLTSVTIAHMHGVFTHQIPIKSESAHSEKFYLSIVDRFINIGHHHTFTAYGRIIAQGSFDRLRFSEEEPKGCTLTTLYDNGENIYEFLPNTNAKIYRTIDCTGKTINESLITIKSLVSSLRKKSQVLIVKDLGNNDLNIGMVSDYLGTTFPNYSFKMKRKDYVENVEPESKVIELCIYEQPTITPGNIVDLVLKEAEIKGMDSTGIVEILKFIC